MRIPQLLAAAALVAVVGTARASSPIPSNYVDDFGPVVSEGAAAGEVITSRASPVPSNQVDDFGAAAVAATEATAAPTPGHASIVPSNYIDDFGLSAEAERGVSTASASVADPSNS
jgi:hypothetical protein